MLGSVSSIREVFSSFEYSQNAEHFDVRIETTKCYMRPANEADLPNHFALWEDREVIALNGDGLTKSREWITNYVIKSSQFDRGSFLGSYSVFRKEDDIFIGSFNLDPLRTEGEISAGILLHKEFQGQRFGFEIGSAICDFIHSLRGKGYLTPGHHPIKALVTTVHPDNVASWKLQERLGMQFTHNGFIMDGKFPRKFYRFDLPA